MGAIFGTKAEAASPGGTPAADGSSPGAGSVTPSSTAAIVKSVDVVPILDKAVATKKEKLG
jgi:Domain of unknown function (DUF3597)